MPRRWTLALLGALAFVLGGRAAWAADEAPAPSPAADVVELPEVVVAPPRTYAPPGQPGSAEATTPLRRSALAFDVPNAVTVQDGDALRERLMVRSVPDALKNLPSVLVQKTAPLQSSPFIRGFTGYRNLVLIDGIRFNNSAFRDGPNQYWSTIDSYTIERLELARGPLSVLYGSDAVGGTLNVIPKRRACFAPGWHVNGLLSARGATAEDSAATRVEIEGNYGRVGALGGWTFRHFGDITSGGGPLPETGGITEMGGDIRFDIPLDRVWSLVFAYQHVGQEDAPRTHSTIFSVPFHGTTVGSEFRRDYDQVRDLAYARVVYDRPGCIFERAYLGVSWSHFWEQRDRLRTRGRRDLTGFDLNQYGVQLQVENCTSIGHLTWGVDYYRDESNTWRKNYVDGVFTGEDIQGPYGDDGHYDLLGAYVEDEITLGRFDLIVGGRFTYAAARADEVADPVVAGNVIQVENDWTNVVGSVRGVYHVNGCWNVYGSVSQAFRAPTLYDLTSFDVTSRVERPAPDIQPEIFVTFEAGVKTEQPNVSGYAAVWYTLLDDTIVRSPTGEEIEGVPVVRKDNIGDGWVWGVEAELAARFARSWTAFGNWSWMNGRADEIDPATDALVRSHLSRLKPFTMLLGVRYEPPAAKGWAQVELALSDREDRLSLGDQADTSRIPPDGTPGWTVVNLRGGYEVRRGVHVGLSLENLFDENYRIHGSGQNEPGFNVVATLDVKM